MSADLLARLVAAGTAAALVAEVALELARAEAVKEELAAVRANDESRRELLRAGNADRQRRHRGERNGKSRVTGVTKRDQALVTPRPPLDKKAPPNPLKELNPPPPVDDKSSTPPEGGQPAGQEKENGKRGSRLTKDWQAPAIGNLPLEVQAIVAQWPAGAYQVTALKFRNHFVSEGRAIGAKRDWPRTWQNWLINESGKVLSEARRGMDYARVAAAMGGQGDSAAAAVIPDWLAEMQAGETPAVRSFRQALSDIIGAQTYGQWLAGTVITIEPGDELAIAGASQFVVDWIRGEFGSVIEAVFFRECGRQVAEMRWEVLRPPDDR